MTSQSIAWYGRPEPSPEPRQLTAGPVSTLIDGADLRHVRAGPTELVQRVYVAVRDVAWNTIPGTVSDVRVEQRDGSFEARFSSRHHHEEIDFEWQATISGDRDGTIRYLMDGLAHSEFAYNKIGFNIHHALTGSVGRPYRAWGPGGETAGVLPREIDPQRIVDGTLTGMFQPYDRLEIDVTDDLGVRIDLEGDLLEMQDHRNWTDANFKSYATPLAVPFPMHARAGTRLRQLLTIRPLGVRAGSAITGRDRFVAVTVGDALEHPPPRLGLALPGDGDPLGERATMLLSALRLDHVRADVELAADGWGETLDRAGKDAAVLGTGLELALHVSERSLDRLGDLAGRLATAAAPVRQVLVYQAAEGFSAMLGVTPAALVRAVRGALQPVVGDIPFAGGTNQNFADINRDRPDDAAVNAICFSISPTVHAADDASIVENLSGQAEVVRMARSFAGGRQILVSPVTLATRFGPYPAGPTAPGDLPAAVDVRQMSLLGAGWTAGSLKYLGEAGADSVTYYETTGWRGVTETDAGSPMPERFPSRAGMAFPVYHVFADVADFRATALHRAVSSEPLAVEVLALAASGRVRLLVSNLTPRSQGVRIVGAGPALRVRLLDETTFEAATRDALRYRRESEPLASGDRALSLELPPFAVATVDTGPSG